MSSQDSRPSESDPPPIRKMDSADIPAVVQVHLNSFPDFFLTFLGGSFLRELYSATLADPAGIGFVVGEDKGVVGFVTGTSQPAGFYRRLLRQRWWRFAMTAVKPVVKRPSIVPRLLRAFSMPGQATQQAGIGTLMSVAVSPKAQGQGIGQMLVRAFLEEAARRDLLQVDLTTDRDNNEVTNRFYQKLGFVCERTYSTPEGRAMNEYVIDLTALSWIGGKEANQVSTLS